MSETTRGRLDNGPDTLDAAQLSAYLRRIGLQAAPLPDLAGLRALHRAHATRIPFENLDIHLGKPVTSDLDALVQKCLTERRGGYCFEQNTLFAAVLRTLGFRLRPVLGRATWAAETPRPRGHLFTLVECEGTSWIADVGFGARGLVEPLMFRAEPQASAGDVYRVAEAEHGWELEIRYDGGWRSMFWFDLAPVVAIDIAVLNFFHSHAPSSFFHRTRVVALPGERIRRQLIGEVLSVWREGVETRRVLTSEAEYAEVLAAEFDLQLPPDAQLRPLFPDGPR